MVAATLRLPPNTDHLYDVGPGSFSNLVRN